MKKLLLNVFVGKDENDDNPYFCQFSRTENGKREVLLSISAKSFDGLVEMKKLLIEKKQIPGETHVFHNGKKLGENGKPVLVETLGRSEFEKIKNIKKEPIMV